MTNRYICTVLDEMRKACETRNFSYLPGLIEEVQSLASRMESALYDQKDYAALSEKLSKLNKEVEVLEAKKKFLAPEEKAAVGAITPYKGFAE